MHFVRNILDMQTLCLREKVLLWRLKIEYDGIKGRHKHHLLLKMTLAQKKLDARFAEIKQT